MNIEYWKKGIATICFGFLIAGCNGEEAGGTLETKDRDSFLALVGGDEPRVLPGLKLSFKERAESNRDQKMDLNKRYAQDENIPLISCGVSCQAFEPLVCPPLSKGLICKVTVFPDDGPMEEKFPPADCFAGINHMEAQRSARAYYNRMFCFGDGGKIP
ncbi:hypothetical protein JWG44_02925 [Leptospira sp. 201903071]|uniref:hypothetical protein n=1 Tax=Leptospira ainazelensis TaxID=2810034 RepID=UPI001964D489|nr:hypothetical protein [Leptospira ainazelensis]MBM9499206.1 hypothetical protein [Leptospira ainazelensis]